MDSRIILISVIPVLFSCSVHSHVKMVTEERPSVVLSIAKEDTTMAPAINSWRRDTSQTVEIGGKKLMVIKAEKDANGDIVASDVLDEATVVARFRNIAERNGAVELRFSISVPEKLLDNRWQVRFFPMVTINDASVPLDSICITGSDYRQAQLRGYQRYERFLASISADSGRFVKTSELEIFLERNIPQLLLFKNDSTYVSDEKFSSIFDVDHQEAVTHYTNRFLVRSNIRKLASKGRNFARWVKSPISVEGIRLDTVLVNPTGDFDYEYVEIIRAGTGVRKASVSLEGAIYEDGEEIYTIPGCEPITYYISSLSAFVDNIPDADPIYTQGVMAIRDRDYKKAVTILRPYRDFNSALAYCAMGYNASALDILSGLEPSPKVQYLKAILFARNGDAEAALKLYLEACEGDRSLIHRGNLDPEIAALKNGLEVIENE